MRKERLAERKPLSFSTTMRNPERIASFLACIKDFEGYELTSDVIKKIIKNVLHKGLYETTYQRKDKDLLDKVKSQEEQYTDEQLDDIIIKNPQNHKEAGFNHGWDSRFDTWYKLPKEFGFLYYEMNKPIEISTTGHMLIDAYQQNPSNEQKIQNVFLNALAKYQSDNPFRKNKNSNVPLMLLLNVIQLLKQDKEENDAGVFRQELSILICWQNNDAYALYQYLKQLRKEVGFTYSDEYIYERCLVLLEGDETKKNRFKISQICGESVDEYIRKMRSTGIISLRGNGRFLDFNQFEIDKIRYLLQKYSNYPIFSDKKSYYKYMGQIDSQIVSIESNINLDTSEIRKKTLHQYAKNYTPEQIFDELKKLSANKRIESKDPVFKFIPAPTRLEFLTSIALIQQFPTLVVNPNYIVDDEGLPTCTASGGMADIVVLDVAYDSLFEVTLMRGRQDQVNNEIVPIRRHLMEYKKIKENAFSVFIAPSIHEDTKEMASWYKYKDNLDILTFDILTFLENIKHKSSLFQLIQMIES
ncbi:AlwI family type II restriction endonuclease [Moraxella boevrei]|uniref:AlwI family type II restriction endonuclease n=1 Tax=Faucicola boevrei TaxID=346665 RepID=UPI00373634D5